MGVYETGIERKDTELVFDKYRYSFLSFITEFLVTGKGKIVEDSNIISEVPWKVGSAV